ncbi:hypothetical protein M5689_018004 [Euphorbia peplus]|nr:hypothetical protein M5689_018004 [Euphorbia peplus]
MAGHQFSFSGPHFLFYIFIPLAPIVRYSKNPPEQNLAAPVLLLRRTSFAPPLSPPSVLFLTAVVVLFSLISAVCLFGLLVCFVFFNAGSRYIRLRLFPIEEKLNNLINLFYFSESNLLFFRRKID